ncbi:unnamed protein product [Lactuca saligna]|uniref:F-box domain-containing protein n=1 Tax=Lactuca saligna TaxID=75948 RepID=A0AA36EPS4_LACSI|nr:unnamed protein product [Lactuca saligna]
MSLLDPSMEDLPVYITADILSRLPVKTIIHCKCVCKKWLDLVSDSYFANLHLQRSPSSLMIHHNPEKEIAIYYRTGILKWLEVEDELHHHHLHHDPVMSLDLNLAPIFQESQIHPVGSVDGLLCLWQFGTENDNTYICNPITREYMILPNQQSHREYFAIVMCCFGVGSLKNEYKVIRIFQGDIPTNPNSSSPPILLEGEIYTIGTGLWRNLSIIPYWISNFNGIFLNGHAHWIVIDQDSPEKLCAFDFDKETFELFPSPPVEIVEESRIHFYSLAVLKGCLCQSDTFDSQFTIWVMKEYGIKKSWRKEVIIRQSISPDLDWLMREPVYVIGGLNDGTILMVYDEEKLLEYSPLTRTIDDTEIFHPYFTGIAYRPSFLKLQNFKIERVRVF